MGQLGGHSGVQNLVAVAGPSHLESPTFLVGTRTQPKLLYLSKNSNMYKSRIMRWAGHVASMGERKGVYRVLVGKPEEKRPLGRPRHRWEDNIKIDLQDVGCGGMDWIDLVQDRDRWRALVGTVKNFRFP